MAMTATERSRSFRARKKLRSGRPMTALERKRLSLQRKQEATLADPRNATPKHQRFAELLQELQDLAGEINRDMLAEIQDKPLTRETARQLDHLESKMRFSFPQIYAEI